jgi:hypothetical protein
MDVAKDYTTKDDQPLVLRYMPCPICHQKFNETGLDLHYEECSLRKQRMEQRKKDRQLGPRQLLKTKKNKLF